MHHQELPLDGSIEIIDEGAGYPDGAVLYCLPTPQGLVTEAIGGGRLVQMLEPNGLLLYNESMTSLTEFIRGVETLIEN